MNILSFNDFFSNNVCVNCISAFLYTPKIIRHSVENRQCNSLLYIASGEYSYTNISKPFTAGAGSIIYIPYGSFHTYEIVSQAARSVQIDFDLYYDGIKYAFSDEAFIVTEKIPERVYALMTELIKTHTFDNIKRRLKTMSVMYELLSELSDCFPHTERYQASLKRIEPALSYIENHCGEKISVSDLCSLCLMSESQLRRLFRQNTGLSPGEYKNEFRVKRACAMLMSGNLAIAEISDVLGFDNVYYFSKVFKKIIGVSPGKYRKEHI